MKKITTLFTILLFSAAIVLSNQAKAQSSCAWAKKAGGTSEDNGAAAATDASGNVYYLGNYYSQNITFGSTTLHNINYGGFQKGADIFLVKYDSCGNFIWAVQAGGNYNAQGKCITTDATGNVYIGGSFNCDTLKFGAVKLVNVGGSTDAFIAKYNSSGVAQWAQDGSGDAQNFVTGIAVDASNNVYATGASASDAVTFGTNTVNNHSGGSGTYNTFTAKFDNAGTNLWLRGNTSNADFNNSGDAIANGIGVDATGNVYVTGYFESTYIRFVSDSIVNLAQNFSDIFLVKYNTAGTLQWLKTAGGVDYDIASGLAADAAGNTYITGYIGESTTASFGTHTLTNNNQSTTMFVAKYDNAGNALWARGSISDDYTYQNQGYKISIDAAGSAYVIGYFNTDSLQLGAVTLYNNSLSTGGGDDSSDVFVAKYKTNGILSWARSIGNTGNEFGYGIATGPNNSLYITGEFDSPSLTIAGTTLTITPGNGGGMGDAFIANNISTLSTTPDICLISADSVSGNYNVIYWDKTAYPTASSFNFYRETSTGVYKKIGSQPYATLSEFVDTARSIGPANGDPNLTTYKYTMQIVDTSGTTSLMSPYHKTAYFQNNTGTFNWNIYEVGAIGVTPVSNCYLMRDDNSTNVWHSIGAVSGTGTSLNDPNFSTFQNTASWRVDQDGFNCTPTLRLASGNNSTDAARIKSHSNQTNNRSAGIEKTNNNQHVSVYPNPANTSFGVETTSTEKQQLQIVDVTGKIVLSQIITGKTTIDASLLSDGVYNITIIGNGSIANKKLVIVK